MRILAFPVIAVALVVGLGGCMKVRIDERSVFKPVPFNEQLYAQTQERMGAETAYRSEADWTEIWNYHAARGELPKAVQSYLAAKVEHGRFDGRNGTLAWTTVTRQTGSDTLIVRCGGNASTRQRSGYRYTLMAIPHGDTLLFDYPGYGETGGEASPERFQSMADDLAALVREKTAGRTLVLWGHSLGGLVCSELSSRLPETKGLIIETSARNAREVAQAWTPWYAAPFVQIEIAEGFGDIDVANALKGFKSPVLVLGAEEDKTLPVQLARSVGKALKEQGNDVDYVEFKGGGHSNLVLQPEFVPTISAFFAKVKN